MRAIFGADPIISGEIKFEGEDVRFRSPKDAIDHGNCAVPGGPEGTGAVLGRSIRDNISMPVLSKVSKGLFLDVKTEEDLAVAAVKRYSIKTPTTEKLAMELSGGNQQKIILGRWTSEKMVTKILILDERRRASTSGRRRKYTRWYATLQRWGSA